MARARFITVRLAVDHARGMLEMLAFALVSEHIRMTRGVYEVTIRRLSADEVRAFGDDRLPAVDVRVVDEKERAARAAPP